MNLVQFMVDKKIVISCAEARRAIAQKAVKVNANIVSDLEASIKSGDIVKFGRNVVINVK